MKISLGVLSVYLFSICLLLPVPVVAQQVSCSIQAPPNSPAAKAYAQHNYAQAFELYSATAKSNPKDVDAIAGQVRSLIREQQVSAADDLIGRAMATDSKSAVLMTALAAVRFRQGRLADSFRALQTAMTIDPCLARTRYQIYRLEWIESMHRSAYEELKTAHELSPGDPDIHLAWLEHLPLAARATALDGYMKVNTTQQADKRQDMQEYVARLRAILAAKGPGCHLASSSPAETTLPFQMLLRDPYHYDGVGFNVQINNKAKVLLELDTGSSGILIDSNTARKAGLVSVAPDTINGIGDQKALTGYWAYAEDLRIGKLEFQNCMVEVSNKRSVAEGKGLIGADVFEDYHVRLDFPLRKMTLTPLPQTPGETGQATGSLNTSGVGNAAASSATKGPSSTAEPSPESYYTDRYVSPDMKTWSPFARFGHQILINGFLKDKQPRLFLVDSGANVSFISETAARSVGKIHADYDDQVTGLNGKVKKIYSADHLDLIFAGLRDPLRDVIILNMDGMSKDNGTEVSGIVGLDTLSMLIVDIDYRDGLIHLTYDPKHGTNRMLSVQ